MRRSLANLLRALLIVCLTVAAPLQAQSPAGTQNPDATTEKVSVPVVDPGAPSSPAPQGPGISLQINGGDGSQKLGTALEIVLLMTLLAMAPALVMTMTCFTRIVVVLSFLKRAMSMQDLPPAMITTGFALFMTIFIMKPVATDIYDNAYTPYVEDQIGWQDAAGIATDRLNRFMLAQTREADVALILELAREPAPATALDTPFHITVPAFVLSEIKTAFQMGFVLFLPFVVIDLVISSILVSMGMFSLPPVVISTPLKLLLFILVGGWDLVVVSLAESFVTT
ncbi:MAG: flagellar type III secretion system pore protein FliP [Planctomycetes bacterium]|nr:flagellar type III secretion system pore protein FliP [Planctomycetota bacterium]